MTEPYRDDLLATHERIEALRASRRELDARISELTELASKRVGLDEEIESLERTLRGPRMDWLEGLSPGGPCRQNWAEMPGDKRVRHCNRCHRNVYHLHGLPRVTALELIRASGDPISVALKRREDGTVVTADCPLTTSNAIGCVAVGLGVTGAAFIALTVAGTLYFPARSFGFRVKAAKVGAETVRQAVELWQSDQTTPTCPTIRDLVDAKKLAASKTDDPWGKAYRIECNGEEVHVYSNGRDGLPNTADDIADDAKPADIKRIADLQR